MTPSLHDVQSMRALLNAGLGWVQASDGMARKDNRSEAAAVAAQVALAHFAAIEAIKSVSVFDAFAPRTPGA